MKRIGASSRMRAAVIQGPQAIRLEERPIPEPGPGQIRVRMEGCGVCGSNLPSWEGRAWFQYPLAPGAPGHEGWGVVDAVGSEVSTFRPGDRVATVSGFAFAEYDVVDASAALKLPPALDDEPVPGEPLGCAMNIFRRSDIHAGQTVAIVGIGFLGALLTRLAANAGARVIAITRRPFALDIARRFGAAERVPMDDHLRIIERVESLTGGRLCHRVIEAVGEQWPLDLSAALTGERGKLVIAGYHQDGLRQVDLRLWNWRGLDVINAHERDVKVYLEGMRLAVEEITEGRVDPRPLYTTFPLEELPRAFQAMKSRPEGFVKALVTM
jgi:threonine dehydrogenase-like Zn-dependent dehydrogenase